MTIYEAYKIGKKYINNSSDLISIFKSVFGLDRVGISINSKLEISNEKLKIFLNKIEDLNNNIPIQYIEGNVDFLGLNLKVGDGVFIPRDETKLLVSEIITNLNENFNGNIIDLCAGTGNIGLSLKRKFLNSSVYEIEKSDKAFEYLKYNKISNNLDVSCILGDIFEKVNIFNDNMFDVIVSNPPYIRKNDILYLDENVKKEPEMALNGGEDGLYFYKKILSMWKRKLKKTGFFSFEIGYDQYNDIVDISKKEGFKDIKYYLDINNIKRVVIIRL